MRSYCECLLGCEFRSGVTCIYTLYAPCIIAGRQIVECPPKVVPCIAGSAHASFAGCRVGIRECEIFSGIGVAEIIVVSPTQLMGALRIVAQMWRHDRQARNAADIAVRSGQMYDKFAGFVDDLLKVERSLDTASATLAEAKKKLCEGKGNLVRRAEVLRSLGAKASRQLSLESDDDQS